MRQHSWRGRRRLSHQPLLFKSSCSATPTLSAGSQQLTLSNDELELLRRQLADQEVLLRAYDVENQLAAARLKEQHAEQRRQATEAVEREQVLAQALAQAQAELERQPPGTPAVDAARLQELLKLQAELGAVRGAAAQRERELKQQVRGGRMLWMVGVCYC